MVKQTKYAVSQNVRDGVLKTASALARVGGNGVDVAMPSRGPGKPARDRKDTLVFSK